MQDRKSQRRSAVKPLPLKKPSLFTCNQCYCKVEKCSHFYKCTLCNHYLCNICYSDYDRCIECNNTTLKYINQDDIITSNMNDFIPIKIKQYCFGCC